MYGTDGYLHQCSLDRDHVCSAMIAEFYGCERIGLEGERSSNDKCCFGSLRLSGMQNVWRNLYARSLFFCQIRNQFFLKRRFFQRSGQKMKIEVVSSDQMTLLQWCMNMNKGFCSFPISQKINRLSLGFALFIFNFFLQLPI
jgi:hypothetical protein